MPLPEPHSRDDKGAGTKDLETYNAYLKGRFYANKGTVEDLRKSIPYFEDAIRRDPSYALAYAGLADAYGNLAGYEGATAGLYSKVRSAALKALQLDESLAEAHTSIAIVKAFYDYDLPAAGEEFRRALALNPNSAMTHDWYSYYLLFFPRWDEAIAVQRRAVQLDPLAIIISADLGVVLMHAGRWEEAIEHLRKTLELDPGNSFLLGALGVAYIGKGMYPEALGTFQKRIDTSGLRLATRPRRCRSSRRRRTRPGTYQVGPGTSHRSTVCLRIEISVTARTCTRGWTKPTKSARWVSCSPVRWNGSPSGLIPASSPSARSWGCRRDAAACHLEPGHFLS
jgi:tetratricopeptide (TPR) repeat protein